MLPLPLEQYKERARSCALSLAAIIGWKNVRLKDVGEDIFENSSGARERRYRKQKNWWLGYGYGQSKKAVEVRVRMPTVRMHNDYDGEEYEWNDIFLIIEFSEWYRLDSENEIQLDGGQYHSLRMRHAGNEHPHITNHSDCLGDHRADIGSDIEQENWAGVYAAAVVAANTVTPEDALNGLWEVEDAVHVCGSCHRDIDSGEALNDYSGGYLCQDCGYWCDWHETNHPVESHDYFPVSCDKCYHEFCIESTYNVCDGCGEVHCWDCQDGIGPCQAENCYSTNCYSTICDECSTPCAHEDCGHRICASCAAEGEIYCDYHRYQHEDDESEDEDEPEREDPNQLKIPF